MNMHDAREMAAGLVNDDDDDGKLEGNRTRWHTAACLGEDVQLGIGDASRETASQTFQLPPTQRPDASAAPRRARTADALSEAVVEAMALSSRQTMRSWHRTMTSGLGSRSFPSAGFYVGR